MPAPKFVAVKPTYLLTPIQDDDTSFTLKALTDIYGNALDDTDDFGNALWITFNPGGSREEIVYATGFTVNANGSVTVDTGVARGRAAKSPYGAGGTAYDHAAGEVVVVANVPQYYDAIIDYAESLANAGAADASTTTKGLVEEATQAEIDAATAAGATAARLFINPSSLATSIYGTRLPSAAQKVFLGAVTGMVFDYTGNSAPTGFLLCDGSSYDNDTYPDLVAVLLGRWGYGTAVTFTANAGTDVITANTHGLSDGNILLMTSTGTLPAGLSANTIYYVRDATTNTFKVSTSVGGSAVDITDTGSGTHSFYNSFKVPNAQGSVRIGKGQLTRTFTFLDAAVNTGTDEITVESNDTLYTGQKVALTNSGGTLPGGLAAQDYYVIRVSATVIKLASSLVNANTGTGTAVDITSAAGGGTHTLTLTMTSRSLGAVGGVEVQGGVANHDHVVTGTYETGGSGSGGTGGGDESPVDVAPSGQEFPTNMPPYAAYTVIIKT